MTYSGHTVSFEQYDGVRITIGSHPTENTVTITLMELNAEGEATRSIYTAMDPDVAYPVAREIFERAADAKRQKSQGGTTT